MEENNINITKNIINNKRIISIFFCMLLILGTEILDEVFKYFFKHLQHLYSLRSM